MRQVAQPPNAAIYSDELIVLLRDICGGVWSVVSDQMLSEQVVFCSSAGCD